MASQNNISADLMLLGAVGLGNKAVAAAALKAGGNPNAVHPHTQKTALFMAVENTDAPSRKALLNLLLAHQADPNQQNAMKGPDLLHLPLSQAIMQDDVESAATLLEHGAELPNGLLMHYLNVKAQRMNSDVVGLLIKHGANVQGLRGGNPASKAVEEKNIACLKLILAANPGDTAFENAMNTALTQETISKDILRAIVESPHFPKKLLSDKNAFHAVQKGDTAALTLLIEAGYKVQANTTRDQGHKKWADVRSADIACVKHGKEISIMQWALTQMEGKSQEAMVALLASAGGKPDVALSDGNWEARYQFSPSGDGRSLAEKYAKKPAARASRA